MILTMVWMQLLMFSLMSVYCTSLDVFSADRTRIKETLFDKFSMTRHHVTGKRNKNIAMQFIVRHFERLPLTVEYDTFYSQEGHVQGINIIGILPGVNHIQGNTDTIYIISGYYDTNENSDGLFLNGAGVVAILEAATILVKSGNKKNTLMFVLFDLHAKISVKDNTEENSECCQGAKHFVRYWLPVYIQQRTSQGHLVTFGGAFIMESILNYNTYDYSQNPDIGDSLRFMTYKELLDELKANTYRGDFQMSVCRTGDLTMQERFSKIWKRIGNSKIKLYPIEISLVFSDNVVFEYIENEIYQSDVFSFYRENYNAILITDTGVYRRPVTSCYMKSCSEKKEISEERLDFLIKTIQTAALSLETLAQGNLTDSIMARTRTVANTPSEEVTTPTPSECPKNLYTYSSILKSYYKMYDSYGDKTTWSNAKASCESQGSQLLMVNNKEVADLIVSAMLLLSTYETVFWVGMSDREEEGHWKLVDGSNMTSDELWDTCQPDDAFTGEDCGALISKPELKLIDLNCDYHLLSYVCACQENITWNEETENKEECFIDGYEYISESNLYFKMHEDDADHANHTDAVTICKTETTTLLHIASLYDYSCLQDILPRLNLEDRLLSELQSASTSGQVSPYLKDLAHSMSKHLIKSKSEGTVKKYFSAFKRWQSFASEQSIVSVPAEPIHVALYLTNLIDKN